MGLMFLQSKLQPATTDNAQQKMLTYGLPLMFGVMGLWFPAGLTVYITTNTLLGIAHTMYMKRSSPLPVKPVVAAKDEAEELPAAKALAKADRASDAEDSDAEDSDADEGDADDSDEGDADEAPAAKGDAAKPARAGQGRRGKRRNKRR
jgi:hypothetical protein